MGFAPLQASSFLLPSLSLAAPSLPSSSFSTQAELDKQHVVDRMKWRKNVKVLRKKFAEDWEKLDKNSLKKQKLKRRKGYQPLSKEALLESARVRWQENEERKAKLRDLEQAWLSDKGRREAVIDRAMEIKKSEKQAAESRRYLWLKERSQDWIPEEDLDLAITRAILDPHTL